MGNAVTQETRHRLDALAKAPEHLSFRDIVAIIDLDPGHDFISADLSGMDLSRQDLTDFNFTGAKMIGSNLTQTQFHPEKVFGVDFTGAVLVGTRFGAHVLMPDDLDPGDSFREHADGPEMVWMPSGGFLMGASEDAFERHDDECPQHEVELSGFAIGRYPVTFEEYDAFCAATGAKRPDDDYWGRGTRPVIHVCHVDAMAYCSWLSEVTGQTYALPTEAQWEYACRAGSSKPTYKPANTRRTDIALFQENSNGRTAPVGQKLPNDWGLYDTLGNVAEWCADDLRVYEEGGVVDPMGPLLSKSRAVRGGSWASRVQYVRSAYRAQSMREYADNEIGFRCVRQRA